jgi:hypothetical protein
MSEVLQFGLHPDADQLSAFVERALPAHERERTLAHLAVCPECRAVVALLLPPVDEAVEPLPEPAKSRWFSGWNLVLSTAVALTATIVFTVYVYRTATARNAPAQMANLRPSPPAAAPVLPPETAAARSNTAQPIGQLQGNAGASNPRPSATLALQPQMAPPTRIARDLSVLTAPQAAPGETRMAASNFMSDQKEAPVTTNAPSAAFGVAGAMGSPGGSSQTPLPAAQPSSNKKVAISAGIASPTEAPALKKTAHPEPATVNADEVTVETTSASVGEVITGTQVRELPLSGENFISLTCMNSGSAPAKPQCPEVHLPSRLPALSLVAQERLVLAIDAQNTVFLSDDAGNRWKAVRAPWTGRAVKAALISSQTPSLPSLETKNAGVAGALFSGRDSFVGKPEGSLSGMVTDSNGAAISGASVAVINNATDVKQTVKTDAMGRYMVRGLAPGVYTIRATAPGFKMEVATGVAVHVSTATAANLSLALGVVTETVTVQADEVQVETTLAAAGENIASPNTTPKPAEKMRAKPASPTLPPPVFEITTDSGERWTSADGVTWTRR